MPSIKSLAHEEYYGNRQNVFWKLMFAVFDENFSDDYTLKLQLIKRNHIGLWDVLQSCERKSSLDSDIINEVPNDIQALIEQYPTIKTLVFSSQKACQYFRKYIGKIEGIQLVTLPSPSGANARMSFVEKLNYWKVLKTLL
ncbi:DNA-deoxyinosine glycosylase [Myroides pelagicus]|uniref:DNA-deoxyinosine glycosylase n=1 Tax=Myroides pelagicus TaxID=270914 RepID=UPI001F0349E8|nr:DNA-deoxyinosine glycosylase [Myroides pelagicus]MEC4113076.1 DNA-deoxyinosine glycosylase [Myroides pelagicus]